MLAGPFTEFYSHSLAGGLATVQHSGGVGMGVRPLKVAQAGRLDRLG